MLGNKNTYERYFIKNNCKIRSGFFGSNLIASQRGKCLEKMVYIDDYYLFSIDGTGYFSSNKIHCKSCCTKTNSKTGEVTYYPTFGRSTLGIIIFFLLSFF